MGIKKTPGTSEPDEESWNALVKWAETTTDSAGHPLIEFLFKYAPVPARLSSEYKRRVEVGEELPPGVEARTVDTTTWTNRPTHLKKKETA